MDLYAEAGDLAADVGAPGLEQRDQQVGPLLRGGIAERAAVDLAGGVVEQRPRALGQGAHPHQHPPHVGVLGDGHRGLVGRSGAGRLHALHRIGLRLLPGGLGHLHPLRADVDPRRVHHREHQLEPVVLVADQLADALVVVAVAHHAGRRGVDAQLVLDADDLEVVARAEGPVRGDVMLGHDEQGDAARSGGRAGGAGQDQVDDVVGQFVLAPGDEDLGALDPVLAGVLAFGDRGGAGPQRADVAARLGLGQVHRPRPLAADQPGQVERLLRLAAVGLQRLDRADRQHRQQGEGEVGRAEVLQHAAGEGEGQALAAEGLGRGDGVPALLDIGAIGLRVAGRQRHDAVLRLGALAVADLAQGGELAGGELADAFGDGLDQVGRRRGEALRTRQLLDAGVDLEREDLLGGGRGIVHARVSWLGFAGRRL